MRHKFPPSWPTRSFKEVAEVITGTTPLTSHPEYYGGSIPFIGPAELGGVESITQSPKSLSDDGVKQARLLPAEAVLVCCIGATIGKVGFSGTELATNQQINALVCDKDIVFPRYVFHYCRTLESLIRHQGASTTLPLLPKGRFQDLEIPIPTLEEQHRIAEVLDRAEELRSKRREAIAQLDTLTQAIFIEMFGDPATNPKGWAVQPVSKYVAEFQGGKSIESESGENILTINRILKVSAVTGMKFLAHESKPVPDSYTPPLAHFVRPGDLLFSRANTTELVGAVAYVESTPSNLLLPDKLWRFVWQKPPLIEPLFVWALFQTPAIRYEISRRATGTSGSMKNISQQKVFGITTIIPPLSIQKEFAHHVEAVEKLKAIHRASLSELDALFASLQHRAFRGEL
jgi:type I restriction enzyme S subunit